MNSFTSFLLLLGIAQKILANEFPFDPKQVIQEHLQKYYAPIQDGSLCTNQHCCNITSTEKCSINQFPKDQSSLILPGGDTRCIFSYSTPYAFQIIPGDSDNLLFYFQGGGACWDQWSTDTGGFCTTDVVPQSLIGVFDRNNEKNRFRSYTVVHVIYCSGDVHAGNTVRPYNDKAGQPVVQVGLKNAQAAVDWVKGQVAAGNLAKTFSNLVIMGCSAGSLGAQLWGQELLSQFQWKQAAIVPDSYAGVFPEGSLGQLIYNYGFCSSGFLSPALLAKCNKQELTLEAVDLEFMTNNPRVPYAFMQSKVDNVQISFYISVGQTTNTSQKTITPTQFYSEVNALFGDYNSVRKNFLTYLMDGEQHCFTPYNHLYTADTKGAADNGATTNTELLYQWMDKLPLASGESIDTHCDGTIQETISQEKIGPDNTYCSSRVVPKQFTEQYPPKN